MTNFKMSNSFYSETELSDLGLKAYGKNVLISKKCSIYSPEKISIGNNVRIDDFCILSGNIKIGNYVHVGPFCALYASKGIIMDDYTGCSCRTTIFSAMDDFSGNYLISPMVPVDYTNVTGGIVKISKFVQIGAGCVVFPNLIIEEGTAIGAMSLVNKSVGGWGIYAGIPCKYIKERKKRILELEKKIFH